MPDQSITEIFWSSVDIRGSDECWEWQAGHTGGGYGQCRFLGRKDYAHRVALQLTSGLLLPGILVRHKCDNPSCCNPRHLVPGTPADNARDRDERGRHRTAPHKKLATPNYAIPVERRGEVESMYIEQKMALAEIARAFDVSVSSVRFALLRHGTKLRSPWERPRRQAA